VTAREQALEAALRAFLAISDGEMRDALLRYYCPNEDEAEECTSDLPMLAQWDEAREAAEELLA